MGMEPLYRVGDGMKGGCHCGKKTEFRRGRRGHVRCLFRGVRAPAMTRDAAVGV